MCRGLAICINKDGKILCNGESHHHELKKDEPEPESFLDYEVILPCWYEPILDKEDKQTLQIWEKKGLLTTRGEPKKKLHNAVVKWLQDNELQVKTWFLFEPGLQGHATINGVQDQRCQLIKGDQCHTGQVIKGEQHHEFQSIEGNQFNTSQTIVGDQYHLCQVIKGDQIHEGQRIDGNQYHNRQVIGGDIYIKDLRQGNKKLQKHLDEFYKTKQDKYTWATFFEWIMKER